MIRLTAAGRFDLASIAAWIRDKRSGRAADRVTAQIFVSLRLLGQFPELGRRGRVEGTREFAIPRLPYVIVYRLQADDLVVLRVMHGAQLWPPKQG